MNWIGPKELIGIILIIIVLFGAKKIPEAMRSIGSGFREFKKGISGEDEKPPAEKERLEKDLD